MGMLSPAWFDSHRTDLAGIAMLAAVIVLIALFFKVLRD
jgi:hypothetical protein